MLFARRFRDLSHAIESARARLADARERESVAEARLAQVEGDISRLRIEVAEADSTATAARNRAHTHELEIQRTQQQVELNRQQVATLGGRIADLDGELASLEARREPQQALVADRRDAAARAEQDRQQAAERLAEHNEHYQIAVRISRVSKAMSRWRAASVCLHQALDCAAAFDRQRQRSARGIQEGRRGSTSSETDRRIVSERWAAARFCAGRASRCAGRRRGPRPARVS